MIVRQIMGIKVSIFGGKILNNKELSEPSFNGIWSNAVLYLFVGNENPTSIKGYEPIEDVYTLNLS